MEDQRNLSYCSTCGCDKIFKKDGLDAWICNECGNKYNLEAARIYSDNIHERWEAWKFRLGCAGCLVSTVAVIVFIVVFGINLFSTFEDISARDLLFFLTMGYFYAGLLQFYMDHHFPTFIGLLTWPKAHVKYIPGSILPEVW